MPKLRGALAAAALSVAICGGAMVSVHAAPARPAGIPSVPEAWSPEGRAPYTPPSTPEAWSPEGRGTISSSS